MKKHKMASTNDGALKPQAWIAVSNNRQKIYGSNENLVYLENGQEFQIELYNPTSTSYLAKIYLNDNLISTSGLVLKPGQRYFLDRHIDEQKKLVFSTYTVDDTKEVKDAIKNNGKVRIDFYPEVLQNAWRFASTSNASYIPWTSTGINDVYWRNSVGTGGYYNYSGINSPTLTNGLTISNNAVSFSNASGSLTNSLETGRVEKGGLSNQSFGSDFGNYSVWVSHYSEYHILPKSAKPVEVSEIREYCPECGTRMKKKTWKFCPNCGESLD